MAHDNGDVNVRKGEVAMKKAHDDGGERTIAVKPSSVKAYERHGWTLVDDGTSETDPAKPSDGADDHKVRRGYQLPEAQTEE